MMLLLLSKQTDTRLGVPSQSMSTSRDTQYSVHGRIIPLFAAGTECVILYIHTPYASKYVVFNAVVPSLSPAAYT